MSYRLLSFQSGREARAGILVGEQIYDAARLAGQPAWSSVLGALQDWGRAHRAFAAAAKRIAAGKTKAKGLPLKRARLLAPVLYPGDIYCAGANYTDLMAVIGRTAKNVPVEKALGCIAGYTIANDLSARDAMKRDKNPPTSPFHYDWVSQKCFDGSCPLGPWIVPAGDLRDPHQLGIKLWVNGELMQDSHTSKLIFDTAEQIAMLSSRVTLRPGDLVLTGTPAGVGMGRGRFLKAGDAVKL